MVVSENTGFIEAWNVTELKASGVSALLMCGWPEIDLYQYYLYYTGVLSCGHVDKTTNKNVSSAFKCDHACLCV